MKTFLSSTYIDLTDHRKAATEALERLGQQVGRMEVFGARPKEPREVCLSEIEECDLFVGIYAHRYGYVLEGSDISITEAEFHHAQKNNKPIFCFLVDDDHPWPPKMVEDELGKTRLQSFKTEIRSGVVRDTFTTPEDLAFKVAASVGRYLAQPAKKRSAIAKSFFEQEPLEKRLEVFEREILGAFQALRSSLWPDEIPSDTSFTPTVYLERAQRIGQTLIEDAALLNLCRFPCIAIDSYDVFSYMAADSRFVFARPVFDYCIEESPFPLVLLPPSALELREFLKNLTIKGNSSADVRGKLKHQSALLSEFVEAYAANPKSAETYEVFLQIKKGLDIDQLSLASMGLPKLSESLRSGKLKIESELGYDFDSDRPEFLRLVKVFNELRPSPRRNTANIRDAVAMAIIRQTWNNSSEHIRMISFVPSFSWAAQMVFGECTPVRTSQDYAYFINALEDFSGSHNGKQFEQRARKLIDASSSLRNVVGHGLDSLSGTARHRALEAFALFAPYYRDMLRPVDDMISSAKTAIPQMQEAQMGELYQYLTSESQIVEGFRRWWDHICEVIRSIEQAIVLGESEEKLQSLYKELNA